MSGDSIAVFDLDGTLIRGDTFVPYVIAFLARHPRRWLSLVPAAVSVALFLLGRLDRDQLKERITNSCLAGASRDEIEACTARFVSWVMKNRLRASAVATVEEHRAAGDRLILLSASPDLYVPVLAGQMGFHECICTELRWDASRLSGRFATANRRGEEKARILRAMRAVAAVRIAAYANSASDLPHLVLADRALLVNGSARTRRRAAELGIECRDWR